MGGAVGAAARRAVPRQGARLRARVLDARPARARALGARGARARRGRRTSARSTSARCSSEVVGHVDSVFEVPPGVDVERVRPAGARGGARGAARRGTRRSAQPRQRERAAPRRGQRRAPRGASSRSDAPDGRLLRQADREQGRPAPARGARRRSTRARCRRLRRLPRRARAARGRAARPAGCSSPGRSSTATSSTCCRSPTPRSCRRSSRRRSGWSPPRRPRAAARRCVARHSGLAEVAAGLEAGYPPHLAAPRGVRRAVTSPTSGAKLAALLALPAADREALRAAARAHRRASAGRGRASPRACSRRSRSLRGPWARSNAFLRRSSSRPHVRRSRTAPTSRVAVEEEFALLDPETLELVEPLRGASRPPPPAPSSQPHLVGELIASEVEVRTGRCADFAEAAAKVAERRGAAAGARPRARRSQLGATGTHPWSRWQDQRIIDTPHYRRNDELLRYVVWRNNTFGLHVHVGIRGGDRAIAVCNALRRFLPELLALSASSPFVEQVDTGLHSARTADLHAHVPALRHPRRLRRLAGLRGLRRVPLPHRLDRRAHPALVERAAAPRLPDRRDPHLRRASPTSARRRRSPRSPTRSRCAAPAPTTRASRCPDLPNRLLEENLWRAIRYGLSGELIDFDRGEPVPARAGIEQLIEWVAPVAEEIGAAPFLAVPAANAAERQQRALAGGCHARSRSTPSR